MPFPSLTFWAPLTVTNDSLQQRAAQDVTHVGEVTQELCPSAGISVFHAYQ